MARGLFVETEDGEDGGNFGGGRGSEAHRAAQFPSPPSVNRREEGGAPSGEAELISNSQGSGGTGLATGASPRFASQGNPRTGLELRPAGSAPRAATAPAASSDTIGGYTPLRPLGHGKHATVWRVRSPKSSREWALKVTKRTAGGLARKLAVAQELASATAARGSDHVVGHKQAWKEGGRLLLLMDLCDKGTLAHHVPRRRRSLDTKATVAPRRGGRSMTPTAASADNGPRLGPTHYTLGRAPSAADMTVSTPRALGSDGAAAPDASGPSRSGRRSVTFFPSPESRELRPEPSCAEPDARAGESGAGIGAGGSRASGEQGGFPIPTCTGRVPPPSPAKSPLQPRAGEARPVAAPPAQYGAVVTRFTWSPQQEKAQQEQGGGSLQKEEGQSRPHPVQPWLQPPLPLRQSAGADGGPGALLDEEPGVGTAGHGPAYDMATRSATSGVAARARAAARSAAGLAPDTESGGRGETGQRPHPHAFAFGAAPPDSAAPGPAAEAATGPASAPTLAWGVAAPWQEVGSDAAAASFSARPRVTRAPPLRKRATPSAPEGAPAGAGAFDESATSGHHVLDAMSGDSEHDSGSDGSRTTEGEEEEEEGKGGEGGESAGGGVGGRHLDAASGRARLGRTHFRRRALSVEQMWAVLRDVARGLAFLHRRGIVHMDVKPSNVMRKGGKWVLGDLGLAVPLRLAAPRPRTAEVDPWPREGSPTRGDGAAGAGAAPPVAAVSTVVRQHRPEGELLPVEEGDSRYLALNVLQGCPTEELPSGDTFALGMSVLELASQRRLPSSGTAWEALRRGDLAGWGQRLSAELRALVASMTAPEPAARPSADEVAARAERALAEQSGTSETPSVDPSA